MARGDPVGTERIGGFVSRGQAEMAVDVLEAAGIDATVRSDQADTAGPDPDDRGATISLEVDHRDASAAREALGLTDPHLETTTGEEGEDSSPYLAFVSDWGIALALTLVVIAALLAVLLT